jgi:predicted transcriptional regulator
MAGKTISQRIALEGGDDIKKKLEELGAAGEKSFKQIADAAQKAKVDPQQYVQTQQALNQLVTTGSQLANQFLQLAQAVTAFGGQGAQATAAVATGLNAANAAAQQTGATMQQAGQRIASAGQGAGESLISTANKWRLAAAGIVVAIGAIVTALTKGAVETGAKIAEQAEKLKLSTEQWVALRHAIAAAGGSFDDFIKGAGKTVGLIQKMKDEIAKVSTTFKVMGEDGKAIDVTVTPMNKLTAETAQAVTAFRSLGVQMKTLQSGDTLKILTETAAIINSMPDGLKKSAAGVQFFGDSWKDVIKALLAAKTATVDSEEAMRKKSRELTADQVDTAKKVKDAWADLSAAIRATRDQIGALFAPGELAKVQWLTQLVDGSRELLKTWLGLSQVGRVAFLENIGDTPVTTAFKILAAISEQLAGIWRDVLVPAGAKLMDMVRNIASSFEGVTTAQVIAGFITLTAAAVALAVAFKGIAFVFSPITAVISLLASFGPILIPLIALVVLFWDQIKAGAQAVVGMIPGSIEKLKQAFGALLQGDFAGAWELFSTAAVEAFDKIKAIVIQTFNDIRKEGEGVFADLIRMIAGDQIKTPWLAELVKNIKEIGVELPGTLALIVTALIAVRSAAVVLAPILSRIFGAEVSGTGAILLGILGQMSGAFQLLASLATIVAGYFTVLAAVVGALAATLGAFAAGVALVIGLFPILAAAIFLFRDQIIGAFVAVGDALNSAATAFARVIAAWVTTPVANAWQWIVDTFNSVVETLKGWVNTATQFITAWVTTPVANAWQWIKDAFQSVLDWIAEKWAAFKQSIGFGGGAPAPAGGGGSGFAAGGLLGGRGSGTSDSNLAWVSRGEFITPARAVAQPGVLAFLEALRLSGGNLRDVLDGMGRFALGGLVAPTLPAAGFAGGGMSHVTIQFPGLPEITGLRASSAVVDELRQAAAMAQVRSGGRKPSRYS